MSDNERIARRVVIEHKDGRTYAVTERDFNNVKIEDEKTYADLGFKIIRWEDGEAYKPASKRAESKSD